MLIARLFLFAWISILCFSLPATAEEPEAKARRMMNALGCKACHSFERSGSTLAPPLDRIGARMSLQQLQNKLTIHQARKEKSFMPSYSTTPKEDLNVILQFLAEQK